MLGGEPIRTIYGLRAFKVLNDVVKETMLTRALTTGALMVQTLPPTAADKRSSVCKPINSTYSTKTAAFSAIGRLCMNDAAFANRSQHLCRCWLHA
jgi:hypothetical protein